MSQPVLNLIRSLLSSALAFLRTRRQLAIEILALRHQLGVLKRSIKRPRLFVFVVLAHDRRCIVSINVTRSPSAAWTANQLVQAFPWETAPRYLLRDRDGIYGRFFRRRVRNLSPEEVIIARRSPWQSPCVERVIGTLRRELLDCVIVLSERHLRRLLRTYVYDYYHDCRTHLSLGKDAPEPRAVEPPEMGEVVELPLVGGLRHRYVRRAA